MPSRMWTHSIANVPHGMAFPPAPTVPVGRPNGAGGYSIVAAGGAPRAASNPAGGEPARTGEPPHPPATRARIAPRAGPARPRPPREDGNPGFARSPPPSP